MTDNPTEDANATADVNVDADADADEATLLRQLWTLQVRALIAEMAQPVTGEEAKTRRASMLQAVSQFLRDNGVNKSTLDRLDRNRGSALAALRDLPTFDDE